MTRIFNLIAIIVILLLTAPVIASQKTGGDDYEYDLDEISVDDWRTDMEAFTIEIPEGWDYEADIAWYDDPLPIYTVSFVTYDEYEDRGWAYLPMTGYIWYEDPYIQQYTPEGSTYSPNVTCMPPMDADEYLEELLIPYLEDEYGDKYEVDNFEVDYVEMRDDLAEDYEDFVVPLGDEVGGYDYQAAEAHVTYEKDGFDVEEMITVILGIAETNLQTFGVLTNEQVTYWALMAGTIRRAPEGELEDLEDMYTDMLFSVRWNQDFMDEYEQIHDEGYEEWQNRQDRRQEDWERRMSDD